MGDLLLSGGGIIWGIDRICIPAEDPEISYSFWNAALGALVARRTQLQFLRLTVPILTDLEMPTPDIIAAFRELGCRYMASARALEQGTYLANA